MNQKLLNFKEKILEEPLSKTDKYWLDQVDFKTNNGNELSLYVDSDFVKSSIEKKLFKTIRSVYKDVSGYDECVFVLDKKNKSVEKSLSFVDEVKVAPVHKEEVFTPEIKPVDLSVFENLLVGVSNNLAITAAKNIVLDPGKRFNPLFIHGEPGVGKTHLLKTMEESSSSSYYIDSESFLESYISGIKIKILICLRIKFALLMFC